MYSPLFSEYCTQKQGWVTVVEEHNQSKIVLIRNGVIVDIIFKWDINDTLRCAESSSLLV